MSLAWLDTHIHVSDIGPGGSVREDLAGDLVAVLDQSEADLRFLISCDGPLTVRIREEPAAMRDVNGLIRDLCAAAPGRLHGSCTVNPHFLDEALECMDICIGEWGFPQLGEMLQYIMDYRMDSPEVVALTRRAVELDVPVQVHISTSNRGTHPSSFGHEQLRDLFGLVHRVPEARYVLAHLVGCPDDDPPVVDGYLAAIEREFGSFPRSFWVEIRDFDSPGARSALERVPTDRLVAGTDWTTRIGPPFLPYGVIFGVTEPGDNPYPPSVASLAGFLRGHGADQETIRRIGFANAAELYGI